jgi:polysaccharide export outer membrane protein
MRQSRWPESPEYGILRILVETRCGSPYQSPLGRPAQLLEDILLSSSSADGNLGDCNESMGSLVFPLSERVALHSTHIIDGGKMPAKNISAETLTRLSGAAVLFVTLIIGGCSSQDVARDQAIALARGVEPTQPGEQAAPPGVIHEGDQVQVEVPGYPEFNIVTNVKQSGSISLPVVGDVQAVGLTKDQLTSRIAERLSDYTKLKVSPEITILSESRQRIVVLGAVATQGSFPLSTSGSIFQILATAGGIGEDADLQHVRIYRDGDVSRTIEVDLSALVTTSSFRSGNIPLVYPGDLVYVPKNKNFIREFGPFLYDIFLLLGLFALIG